MNSQCLELDILMRYIDGLLTDKDKDRVEEHLLTCDKCLEEFVMAKLLFKEVDLSSYSPGPVDIAHAAMDNIRNRLQKVVRWVTSLVPPDWMLNFAMSPVRSISMSDKASVKSLIFRKRIDDLLTEMYISSVGKKLSICITVFKGDNRANNVCMTIVKEGGRPVARILTHEYEVFDKLQFGSYSLTLEQNAKEKGKILFSIDDDGFYDKG